MTTICGIAAAPKLHHDRRDAGDQDGAGEADDERTPPVRLLLEATARDVVAEQARSACHVASLPRNAFTVNRVWAIQQRKRLPVKTFRTSDALGSRNALGIPSDTFTRPTEAMRRAMATAEVGDDVWGEDPTVIALEERAAAAVGKEAAVFVPSGTMGNAIGMRLHAGQGDALWAHDSSHVIDNERRGRHALGNPAARHRDPRRLLRRGELGGWCRPTTPTTTTRSPAWSASRTPRPPPRARRGRSSGWPRSGPSRTRAG